MANTMMFMVVGLAMPKAWQFLAPMNAKKAPVSAETILTQVADQVNAKLETNRSIQKNVKKRKGITVGATPHLANGFDDGVSVIVPGHGDYKRAPVLQNNIQWLQKQGVDFDCRIFVYLSEQDFPLEASDYSPCQLIRHAGFWMDHMLAFSLAETRKKYVMHMPDGIRIGPEFQLQRMIDVMSANDLAEVAPSCSRGDSGGCVRHMYHMDGFGIGRRVDWIEPQINIYTREYFSCWQRVSDPVNKFGWAIDWIAPRICGGKFGIVDDMTVHKEFQGSYDHAEALVYATKYIISKPEYVEAWFHWWLNAARGHVLGRLLDPARPKDSSTLTTTPTQTPAPTPNLSQGWLKPYAKTNG